MAFLESSCIRTVLSSSVLNRCKFFSCGSDDLDSFFLNDAVNVVFWLDAVKLGDFIGKFDFIKTFIDGSLMWNNLEKLIPLFINNIRHKKLLPVYGKGENVRDWLFVEDHARAIDVIFHNGKIAENYNIGGFNEWKNIDIIKVVIKTVDRLLGREEGATFCSKARSSFSRRNYIGIG